MSTDPSRSLRQLRYIHTLFRGLFALLVLLSLANTYVFTWFRVDGTSMVPTLRDRQLIPVYLAAYWSGHPKAGDVVIISYEGESGVRFVKRVTAVPGDTVEFNGRPLTLAAGQYFVMGDNRDHSTDSRTYGPVKEGRILGRVLGK